ncbi:MAG: energy transducer TonB [Planctomycetota bacterium]|nr:energy transducer TonB [Planctomycetota bacterium]
MNRVAKFIGIFCAAALHLAFLLFGGLLFPEMKANAGTTQMVELLSDEDVKPDEVPATETPPEVETPPEKPPDPEEVLKSLDQPADDSAPALDASSLAALSEALLGGGVAGGDFAASVGFASGGRIGGTGTAGALGDQVDRAFTLAEIDQQPRANYQGSPVYPQELRGRKLEGVVSVIFVVDASGKVLDPRAEKSSHAAFEKPAVEAVKRWKFDPAVKSGRRVACKMRVSVRFPPG